MHKVTPDRHEDGTETVTLYGTTVDVTGKKEFTLFKKQYKVYRPREKKGDNDDQNRTSQEAQPQNKSSKTKESLEVTEQDNRQQPSISDDETDEVNNGASRR